MQSDLVQGYTGARAGPAWIFSERNTWEKVESLIKLVSELLALFFALLHLQYFVRVFFTATIANFVSSSPPPI